MTRGLVLSAGLWAPLEYNRQSGEPSMQSYQYGVESKMSSRALIDTSTLLRMYYQDSQSLG